MLPAVAVVAVAADVDGFRGADAAKAEDAADRVSELAMEVVRDSSLPAVSFGMVRGKVPNSWVEAVSYRPLTTSSQDTTLPATTPILLKCSTA